MKYAFVPLFLISFLMLAGAGADPIHHYTYDETTSDSVAIDVEGDTDFYLYNALKEVKIINNSAFFFYGKDSKAVSSSAMNVTNNMTVSAWINITYCDDSYNSFVVGQWDEGGSAYCNWQIQKEGESNLNKLKLCWRDDADNLYSAESSNTITVGQWYYYTLVYKYHEYIALWLNGEEWINYTATPEVKTAGNKFYISYWETDYAYINSAEMYIDELKIYNRTMTESEIKATYQEYQQMPGVPEGDGSNVISFDVLNLEDFVMLSIIMSVIGAVFEINNKKEK